MTSSLTRCFKASLSLTLTTLVLVTGCSSASKTQSAASSGASYKGLGAESVSPEVLTRFAAKPIDADLSRRIQKLLDIRAPGMGIPSPDGKNLIFSWDVTGTRQVWKLSGPNKFPTQMTGGEDFTAPVGITPDGKWLILTRDRKGEENPGLFLQKIEGGELVEVQHKRKVQTFFQGVSDDSRYIYFSSNDIKPDSYAIYRYEIASKKRETLWEQPGLWGIADIHPDGTFLLSKQTGSLTAEYSTIRFDRPSPIATPVIGQGETDEYQVKFAERSDRFFVLTPKFGEFRRLYRYQAGKFTPLTPDRKMDVEDFSPDHKRQSVYLAWNDRGYTKLEVYSLPGFIPVSVPKFPKAENVYVGSISRNGRYAVLGVETGQAPRVSYLWNRQTGALTQWLFPSKPEVDLSTVTETMITSYPARDGTPIPMLVKMPAQCKAPTAKPCPVIAHFHGGPEAQSRPGFSPVRELFTQAGFIFVEPNVRGSDGYGKTWINSDNGPKRLDVITDIEDAAIYLKKTYARNGVTPKVGIFGGSYGGYSVLYAMTKFAGAYDAGVAIVGMSSLVTFLNNTAPYRRKLRITEYGDPEKDLDALNELSPITHIKKIKSPLLIIQGANDPRVPAGEAVQMYDAIASKGIPSGLILFADEGHGSAKRENRVLESGHTFQFFAEHLELK